MTHIQQRRDTFANWTLANPVLLAGEAGHETNTGRWKLGDGVTPYTALPYKGGVDSVAGKTGAVALVVADVGGAAPLNNPVFTGAPTAPTPSLSSNTTRVATTEWVQNQAYAVKNSPSFLGNPTAPTPSVVDNDTTIATTAFVKAVVLAIWPVGSIFTHTVNTNPSTFIGGTWAAHGSGRVLVGVDPAQPEFDTVNETGGAKTHALTRDEAPNHTHKTGASSTTYGAGPAGGATVAVTSAPIGMESAGVTGHTGAVGANGAPHNNLQPYTTVYFFRRTA